MVTFETLGGVALRRNGRELEALVASPKRLGLLAYLVLARPRGFRRRDEVLALFWPERGQKAARNALRNLLYQLRQALGKEVIVNRGNEEVGVDTGLLWTDAVAFEEALDRGAVREALDLYRGDLLTGFHLPKAAPAFEHWLDRERERLRLRAGEGAWILAEEAEQTGDRTAARDWTKRAARFTPYATDAHARLITVLDRLGHPQEALRAFEAYAALLRDEWEIAPPTQVAAIAERIRTRERSGRERTARDKKRPHEEPGASGQQREPLSTEGLPRGDGRTPLEIGTRHASALPEQPVLTAERDDRQTAKIHPGLLYGSAVGLLVVLLAVGWILLEGEPSPRRLGDGVPAAGEAATDARAVAVLPFEVTGAGAQTWRDGMVTVVSAGLDGAGGLRAVSERAVFAAWARADADVLAETDVAALEMAKRLGAHYVVTGSAVALGPEVRLTADVHETRTGRRLGQSQVQGAPEQVMTLADELTREVLGLLLKRSEEAIPSVNLGNITTESLPALKAFLEGELYLRAGTYGAAAKAFEVATREDSTFALAYARLGSALWWSGRGGKRALEQAHARSDRLTQRERRRIHAIYLRQVEDRVQAAAESLRVLAATYPLDPSIWYDLGETIYHGYIPGGKPEAELAFQKAVELDPGVAHYHTHLVNMAFNFHRDSALVARRIGAHPARDVNEPGLKLVFGSPEQRRRMLARLDTIPVLHASVPFAALTNVMQHPRDLALQREVIRRLRARGGISPRFLQRKLIVSHLHRGQVRRSIPLLLEQPEPVTQCELAGSLALDYPVSASDLRQLLDPSSIGPGAPPRSYYCAGVYLIMQERSAELPALVSRMREAGELRGIKPDVVQAKIDGLEGFQAWRAGDLEQAARLWSDAYQPPRHWSAIVRGDLYRDLGQPQMAEDWYLAAWRHPLAHERLGQIYEDMNRPDAAAEAYERFVVAWKDADAPLQARRRAARERLARLPADLR